MNENIQRIAIIACALMVIGVIAWFSMGDTAETERRNWYFDINTGLLFKPEEMGDVPQVAPSGDMRGAAEGTLAGVPAMVVRIGSERRILYLQMRDPASIGNPVPGLNDVLVAPKPPQAGETPIWIGSATPAGRTLIYEAQSSLRDVEWSNDQP